MRQHNFVFDVDNQKMGIAKASCSEDPNQVKREHELILAGQRYALDPTHTESVNEKCGSDSSFVRAARVEQEYDPQPREDDSDLFIEPEKTLKPPPPDK